MNSRRRGVVFGAAIVAIIGWVGVVPGSTQESPQPMIGSPPPSSNLISQGEVFTTWVTNTCDVGVVAVLIQGLQLTAEITDPPIGVPIPVSWTIPVAAPLGTYPILGSPEGCVDVASPASVTVTPPQSIKLVKTVGTDPTTCGAATSIAVPAGTTVFYCYSLTNNSNSTLVFHRLWDDELGTVFDGEYPTMNGPTNGLDADLPPGATIDTVALGKVMAALIDQTTTNTATWYATTCNPVGSTGAGSCGSPPQRGDYTATASATVTLTPPPVAVAAEAAPSFSG